jgi:hypothetical protein
MRQGYVVRSGIRDFSASLYSGLMSLTLSSCQHTLGITKTQQATQTKLPLNIFHSK